MFNSFLAFLTNLKSSILSIISFFDISLTNSMFLLFSVGVTKKSLFSNKYFRLFLFLVLMFFCLELLIFLVNSFLRTPVVESLPLPESVQPVEVSKVPEQDLSEPKKVPEGFVAKFSAEFSAQKGFWAKSFYVFESLPVDIQGIIVIFLVCGLPVIIYGSLPPTTPPPTPPSV